MFHFLNKNKRDTEFVAPATGELMPITEVNDEMFAGKMLGDGFAVKPESGDICSPVSGKVLTVFPTKHAIGMVTKQGDEVIIHMGIDTVSLGGKGIEALVTEGEQIKAGAKLAKMDLSYLREQQKDDVVIVIVTSMSNIETIEISKRGSVKAAEIIGAAVHKE